jgi:hypothetical protein
MWKRLGIWSTGFLLLLGLAVLSGCMLPDGKPDTDMDLPSNSTDGVPGPVTSALLIQPTNPSSEVAHSAVIFSQSFAVLSGGHPVVIDPLEYGYHYFSPQETYSLSVDSGWPVNILVLDSIYADRIPLYLPDYAIRPSRAPDRTVSYSYGFLYDYPLVVQEENVIKKTVTFRVPRTGKYLVIIDPRFHGKITLDMYGVSTMHDYFRTNLELNTYGLEPAPYHSTIPGAVNEVIGLSTSFLGMTKVYALDELGYPSLSPGDIIHVSVVTTKPVNILVLDGEAMASFYRDFPVEETIPNRTVDAVHRGYSYRGISPHNGEVFHEDMSLDTEAFVTIPKQSKYYVVIDPRFSYELSSKGGIPTSYTADFISAKMYIEVLRENSPLSLKKLGDFSLRKGAYEAAEVYYRKSIAVDPENPDTWYNLGIVLRDLGKYREAIQAFNQTLRLQPGDADVWEKIGILYLQMENEEAAREAFNRSLIP